MGRLTTLRPRVGTLDTRVARMPRDAGAPPQTANQSYDAQRRHESAARRLYGTRQWQALRANQLRIEPLCRMCQTQGRVTPATVCDHVEPHRGDVERFWAGPFQSVCAPCHNSEKQRQESQTR